MSDFYVDLETSAGVKLGSGPLTSVSSWRYTSRFDRAGTIDFAFAASDAQASVVTNRTIARAYALLNGVWTEVGAGRVDTVDTAPGADGNVQMAASGLDLFAELRDRTVGDLELYTGSGDTLSGMSHAAALTAIGALAPSGWTFAPAAIAANDYIYARFGGESVLGALVALGDKTQTHFYRGSGRTCIFTGDFVSSGVRAIQAHGDLAPETCAITSLRRTTDTHDYLNRIYPYGGGSDHKTALTLHATTRTAPAFYTLNKTLNYISYDAGVAAHGLVDFPAVEFKDIAPLHNTRPGVRAAANMLFDAALEELRRRSSLAGQETYAITVAGCSQLLRPLQTMRLIYRDVDQGIDIDEELYILEATWEVDTSGVRTSSLVVSTQDRWPESDASAAAERAAQGRVFQVLPQMGPNEWWENGTLFVGSDQAVAVAEYPFVLSSGIVTLWQVLFRFRVTEPYTFSSTTSAEATSSGSSSEASSEGGSAHSHTVTIAAHTHGVTVYGVDVPSDNVTARQIYMEADTNRFVAAFGAGTDDAATSSSGGSSTPTSSAESTHTHGIEHTHTVTPILHTIFNVFKHPAGRTYAMSDLEFSVNGGILTAGWDGDSDGWADLDLAVAVGDGYYELDLTDELIDADTFRPLYENNLVEVRRKASAGNLAIEGVFGDTIRISVTTTANHGLSVGDEVLITGTTNFNGTFVVSETPGDTLFYIAIASTDPLETSGTVSVNKAAMIYVKLGVACTIQSSAFI